MPAPNAADLKLRQQAIKEGRSSYTRTNGTRYTIRNRSNPNHQSNYGGQGGRDERSSSRKGNRGGGKDGSRAINEQLATPDGANRKAFGQAMADANAQGMHGDHIAEVSRTAEGIRWKEREGRGSRDQYHENYRRAGVSIGNTAGNVQPLPPDVNQRVKPGQLRDMDEGIKNATGGQDVLGRLRSLSMKHAQLKTQRRDQKKDLFIDVLSNPRLQQGLQQGMTTLSAVGATGLALGRSLLSIGGM